MGKKPFRDRPHDHYLMLDILKGERPQITYDTPEFYAKLMKRCWDHNPENRPTAEEIHELFDKYHFARDTLLESPDSQDSLKNHGNYYLLFIGYLLFYFKV